MTAVRRGRGSNEDGLEAAGVSVDKGLGLARAVNAHEAKLILGVSPGADLDEAKRAYQRRAKLLHPDRQQDPAARAEAESAMSQLNEAWRVVREVPAQREAPAEDDSLSWRPPGPNECLFCGWGPAVPISVRRNVGYLLWYKRTSLDAVVCHGCGSAIARHYQRSTMIWGWLGPFSALCNLVNIAQNMKALRALEAVALPRHRDPAVVTPMPGPMPLSKLGLAPFIVSLAAVIVYGNIVAAIYRDTTKDKYIGQCYNSNAAPVSCDASDADWQVVSHLSQGSACPSAYASGSLADGTVLCLGRHTP